MHKFPIALFQEFSEERFTKRVIYKQKESTAFVLNFMPGQGVPSHQHPGSNLYLLVIQGEGTVTVDEQNDTIEKGDVIYCEQQEFFSFKNTGEEPVSLFVVLSKIPDDRYTQDI